MTRKKHFEPHPAPLKAGASFSATKEAGLAIVTPLTSAADQWLRQHAGDYATWLADGLAMEVCYFPDLADAIIAAGFLFEREAYPD